MGFSFRKNALIVSMVMIGLLIYQGYWLNSLYNTMYSQQDKNIKEAMAWTDQLELFTRFDKLKNDTTDSYDKIDVNAHYNPNEKDTSISKFYASKKPDHKVSIGQNTDNDATYNALKEKSKSAETLAVYIQKGIHQALDSIFGINLQVYDSLINQELENRSIHQPYYVQLVQLAGDSVLSAFPKKGPASLKGYQKYDYSYDVGDRHAFRLYIKNPGYQILIQMLGIVFTSIGIFVILIYIFIYLLKTIRKMQTEEELKTNFTNNMTHELKTPIAVAFAAVDALLVSNQPASPERLHKYLQIARQQMQSLTGLVEQILAISRRSNKHVQLKPEVILIEKMVSDIMDKLKLIHPKQIALNMDIEVPSVVADKLHLYNMLNNLMENSVKYSGEEVLITVKSRKEAKKVIISIEDNGQGIDSKYMERIFDKFYRIPTGNRHDVKGFGLGLFYVKEMAEMHGGTVNVTSIPGKGSSFSIIIPQ